MWRLSSLLLFLALTGCASAPPVVSPEAAMAFRGTQAIKSLDLFRDFAIDAEAQTPKVLSTDTTRKIVTYHRSAITIIHDIPNGWKATVQTGLDELLRTLPALELQRLAPYVALIRTLLETIP